MKNLLIVTAGLEAAAGLTLLGLPSLLVSLLLGGSLDTPSALVVARMAGAALLALAVACWLARGEGPSRAARGLVAAMLLYNIAVGAVLAYAGTGLGFFSVFLWPAVVLHIALAVWCIVCLQTELITQYKRRNDTKRT